MYADGRVLFHDRAYWIEDAIEALNLFRGGELSFWAARDLLDDALKIFAEDDLTEREFAPVYALFDVLFKAVHEDEPHDQQEAY